jgi:hypothetical protein
LPSSISSVMTKFLAAGSGPAHLAGREPDDSALRLDQPADIKARRGRVEAIPCTFYGRARDQAVAAWRRAATDISGTWNWLPIGRFKHIASPALPFQAARPTVIRCAISSTRKQRQRNYALFDQLRMDRDNPQLKSILADMIYAYKEEGSPVLASSLSDGALRAARARNGGCTRRDSLWCAIPSCPRCWSRSDI